MNQLQAVTLAFFKVEFGFQIIMLLPLEPDS